MKQGWRVVPAAVWATLLLALAAAGCGGKGGKSAGPVTVTFWEFFPEATVRPLVERFEAEHPDVRVEMQQLTWQSGLEKITAAAAAGNPPDLCELGSTWFSKFAANGALADLTDDANRLRPDYLMWDACTFDGKLYALPWMTGTRALFYNRALAGHAGLDPGRAPETWDDLLAFAKAVNDPARQVAGFGMNSGERYIQFKKFMPFAWGNGGSILSPDQRHCTFDQPAVEQALDFYLKLKPYSLLEKQEVLDQAFKDGKLGATVSGAWLLKTIARDAPGLDYGVALVPRPAPDEGTHASFGGGELLAVFKKSQHREAALKLARYLIDGPQAMAVTRGEQSVLPAAVGAAGDSFFVANPRQAVFLKQLQTAVLPPNVENWVEIEDVVDSWLEKAVYGKAAPGEALHQACREIDVILARNH